MPDTPKRNFRRYNPRPALLRPPHREDWLPGKPIARFIPNHKGPGIDLTLFLEGCGNREGDHSALPSALMLKPWLSGYCVGTVSSRRGTRATCEDGVFRSPLRPFMPLA
jgi:hypothetical protein